MGMHNVTFSIIIIDANLFEEIRTSSHVVGNFFPFPSKLFFLLFVLLNSPRPLVSVKNVIHHAQTVLLYYRGSQH